MHLLTCLYFSFTYVHTSLESLPPKSSYLDGSSRGSRPQRSGQGGVGEGVRASIREKGLEVS